MEMDEALKAGQKVEVCSEEGLQKFSPYGDVDIQLCIRKSPPSIYNYRLKSI